jgi:hypothetical protein
MGFNFFPNKPRLWFGRGVLLDGYIETCELTTNGAMVWRGGKADVSHTSGDNRHHLDGKGQATPRQMKWKHYE